MSFCSPDRSRIARKQHTCTLCGEPIEKGARYFNRVGKNEGDFWETKMHPECEEKVSDWNSDDWEGFEPGQQDRPETSTKLRVEINEGAEFLEIVVWNTKRVEVSMSLRPKDGSGDPRWDYAMSAFEATVVAFIFPGGMDIHSVPFKRAIEQALSTIITQYNSCQNPNSNQSTA